MRNRAGVSAVRTLNCKLLRPRRRRSETPRERGNTRFARGLRRARAHIFSASSFVVSSVSRDKSPRRDATRRQRFQREVSERNRASIIVANDDDDEDRKCSRSREFAPMRHTRSIDTRGNQRSLIGDYCTAGLHARR